MWSRRSFTPYILNVGRPKLRRNIEIHEGLVNLNVSLRKLEGLHYYDFGPNGNYWESLKALRVLSLVPAGPFCSSKKHLPSPPLDLLGEYQNQKKRLKTKPNIITPKKETPPRKNTPQHSTPLGMEFQYSTVHI